MTDDHGPSLTLGAELYTADGEKIGTVKELASGAFHVDAPMELDYWLPVSSVAESTDERVTLTFPWEELGIYKMSDPQDIAGTAAAETTDPGATELGPGPGLPPPVL